MRCNAFMFGPGPVGRRANPVWQANIFLLPGPDIEVLPSSSEVVRLSNHGLVQTYLCPTQETSPTLAMTRSLFPEPSSAPTLSETSPVVENTQNQHLVPEQVLFDCVGQDEMASEIFSVQEATLSTPIESTSSGSLMDHGINTSATLYVLWISTLNIQEMITDQPNNRVFDHPLPSAQVLATLPSAQVPAILSSVQALSTPPFSQAQLIPAMPSDQAAQVIIIEDRSLTFPSIEPPMKTKKNNFVSLHPSLLYVSWICLWMKHYMYSIPSQHFYIRCLSEGECSPIALEMILELASGASTVPPLGFPHRPQIEFLHEANKIVLHLPVHTDYESFKKYMKEGVLQTPTFSVA
ncbi:hypothetical protein SRHO_G00107390 [Serrasalmus rhombeus]